MNEIAFGGFSEIHCHLDKTLTIEAVGNESGTLLEAIRNWVAYKPQISYADYLERASRALEMALQAGTTRLRTHVDIDSSSFLALEAMLEVRQQFMGKILVQIVALGSPSQQYSTMQSAMQMGADLVGGCPAICPDGVLEVRRALELAAEFGRGVDLHIDENDSSNFLEVLADLVLETGFTLPVTAGHCCSLDFMAQDLATRVIEKVAAAKINIVSLPACNLNLQGREQHPMPRGITRVRELLAAGVNVCFGSDNVQDPFHPVGNYDLLYAAHLGATATHLTHQAGLEQAFAMVSRNADLAMGLESIESHKVWIEAKSQADAVRSIAKRRVVGTL